MNVAYFFSSFNLKTLPNIFIDSHNSLKKTKKIRDLTLPRVSSASILTILTINFAESILTKSLYKK